MQPGAASIFGVSTHCPLIVPEHLDFINQTQYDDYTAAWLALLDSGNDDALVQAFQIPGAERINFLTFSISQVLALVSAADAHLIKARFLLMPDATGQARFSITLFAVDVNGHLLSAYYIPTQAAATATQAVEASAEQSTKIPRATALTWLTNWVETESFNTALFTTSNGPLHGYNFEVSAFQDPLAGAQPYGDKCLFLNLGLDPDAEAAQAVLVIYIGQVGSRTQGTLAGLPASDVFYDSGSPCPPSP